MNRINEPYEEKIRRWISNGVERFVFLSENKPAFVIPITENTEIDIIEKTEADTDGYGDIITINNMFDAHNITKSYFSMDNDTKELEIVIHCEHTMPYVEKKFN